MTAAKPKAANSIRTITVLAVLAFVGWWFFLRGSGSHPWSLTAPDAAHYTGEAVVGGNINVVVTLANSGSAPNPKTELQFSDIGHYADLSGCEPACEVSNCGGQYAHLPGVVAGQSTTYVVHFIAKAVGAPHWTVCAYDDSGGSQIYCGALSTVIR